MKVLLTGATGFVGTALRKKLVEAGHSVRALVRTENAHKIGSEEGIEVLVGDVLDTHACMRATDGITAIVNCVGILREFPQVGTTYEALNVSATYNLIDAGQRQGVKRFVQMSTLGAAEDAPTEYQKSKWEAEEILKKSSLRWTIFRPAPVFGAGDQMHQFLVEAVHATLVPIVDGYQGKLQPVSRKNLTDAMAACLHMPETQGETYDVVGKETLVQNELLEKTARHYEIWNNNLKTGKFMLGPKIKVLSKFKRFPLTLDQMIAMTEDLVGDSTKFTQTFGVELDGYSAGFDDYVAFHAPEPQVA